MLAPHQPTVESRLLRLLLNFVQSISLPAALALGIFLGDLASIVLWRRNRIGLRNIEIAFGRRLNRSDRKRILRGMWRHLGCNAMEFFRMPLYRGAYLDHHVSWKGLEHIQQAVDRGSGVLLLSAHVGNWDLLSLCVGQKFAPVALVVKSLKSEFWNRFVVGQRMEQYVRSVSKKHSARAVMRVLRNRGLVGMVFDQDAMGSDGRVFVDFFGLEASTISSPAVFSQRFKVPVVPVFISRQPRGRHQVNVYQPLDFEEQESFDEGIRINTRRYVRTLEDMITRHPEQWIWIHRRWKRRPADEEPVY